MICEQDRSGVGGNIDDRVKKCGRHVYAARVKLEFLENLYYMYSATVRNAGLSREW